MTLAGKASIACDITEPSQVGEARRTAAALAERLHFAESEAGKVAIVVTEAATNLLKHAQHGQLVLRPLHAENIHGLEVLALDQGPGLRDVAQCLRDGYSTAGSPGTGLGSMARLSSLFALHTAPGAGTALLARFWAEPRAKVREEGPLQVAAVCLPKRGEQLCGDAWAIVQQPGRALIVVADGLGHGPQAAQAAQVAVRIFTDHAQQSPTEILQAAHAALRSTRGAAMAVVEVLPALGLVRFAGIGNIAGTIQDGGESRSLASHNGTVGFEMRKVHQFDYPWPAGALLVLHSDGLQSQWRLDRYPGLARKHPALVAGVLYRDFQRGRDDVTVLAARVHEESAAP